MATEECTKNLEKFVDFEKCLKLIDDLKTNISSCNDQAIQSAVADRLLEDFCKTINRYQEQPELLEPYIPDLISRLTGDLTTKSPNQNAVQYHTTFKYLNQLVKLSGFKSIGKRFPHEADKLPLIVDLLESNGLDTLDNWATRIVLTVWLSIAILTPFDLVKFDAGSKPQAGTTATSPIAQRIYTTLVHNLKQNDSNQHATAFCLAKFFSRPDNLANNQYLSDFLQLSLDYLRTELKYTEGTYSVHVGSIGYLRALAYIYKFLPRDELQRRAPSILALVSELRMDKLHSELVYHLLIKLVQRVGLALLPKRVASWRYKRGARILGTRHPASSLAGEHKATMSDERGPAASALAAPATNALQTEDEDASQMAALAASIAPNWLESILSTLFVAAQDSQTKVRWSAAKGIARLASRLDRERAIDVIDMILGQSFDENATNDSAWHGGCLALAEMSRQGLIVVEKLEQVIQTIGRAIIYDYIKGLCPVGAHVRESACYVIWAMARAYDDQHLKHYIGKLSINLMCTIVFDRELQCRRAASATFQELIGRQGTFEPDALALLAHVDYQNVGQRHFAYLELAPRVASIGGARYYEPFVAHLIGQKLGHFDLRIRRLASDALGLLMLHAHQGTNKDAAGAAGAANSTQPLAARVLGQLEPLCQQQTDNNLKHGALLALAKLIKSLVPLEFKFSLETKQLVASVAQLCDKQLKSKQQANNFLDAICQLIVAAQVARFEFEQSVGARADIVKSPLADWERLVLTALDSDLDELRQAASDAFLALYSFHYANNKCAQDRLLTVANKTLATSYYESSRCGAIRCLAKLGQALSASELPKDMAAGQVRTDSDTADIIFMSLTGYLARETRVLVPGENYKKEMPHAKAACCEAIVEFVRSLDAGRLIISTHWLQAALDALLFNAEDYLFNAHGDIGVLVRKAAVRALQQLCSHLIQANLSWPLLWTPGRLQTIVAKMLQQCVSYNNAARELAGQCFFRLIESIGQQREHNTGDEVRERELEDGRRVRYLSELVPHYELIVSLFERRQLLGVASQLADFSWRDDSTPIFVELLACNEYSRDLWLGLVPALGQASELCAKQFRDALADYIRKNLLCDDLDTRAEGTGDKVARAQLRDQVFQALLELLEEAATKQQPRSLAGGGGGADGSTGAASAAAADTTFRLPTTIGPQRLLSAGLLATDYLLTQGLMNETSSKLQERLVELCWQASRVSSSSSSSTSSSSSSSQKSSARAAAPASVLPGAQKGSAPAAATTTTATTTDPRRLMSVSRVLCSMLQFQSRQVLHKCLQYCLALMGSSMNTVRAYTAEQLYTSIMLQQLDSLGSCDEEDKPAGGPASPERQRQAHLERAMDLLSQTQWVKPLAEVRPIRAEICSCLAAYYSIDLRPESLPM